MSQSRDYRSVRVEIGTHDPRVAQVTLVGPGKNNAMGPDFWSEMPDVMAQLDADPQVRAIVIAGSGRNFSYGLDLATMMPVLGPMLDVKGVDASRNLQVLELIHGLRRAIDAVFQCRTPTIAAVQGRCLGGGVDLISACDIRHCSAQAQFSIREIKVGIVADMGSLGRLPHIIGSGLTRELALTGRDIGAAAAERYGLVSHVAETADDVVESAHATAAEIAANPPLVVRGVKEVLDRAIANDISDSNHYVAAWNAGFLASRDLTEAVTATLEGREPHYTGM